MTDSLPTNQRVFVLSELRALSGLCDSECFGRCKTCPADAVVAAISYIESLLPEPSAVLRQLVDEARGMCSDEWQARADAALGISTEPSGALDHGEYLAKAVEAYMEASNELAAAHEMGDIDDESEVDPAGYMDAVSDCWKGMKSAIHEFRKRAGRLAPTKCATCNGRGEISGFDHGEAAYRTEPCPDCSAPTKDAQL